METSMGTKAIIWATIADDLIKVVYDLRYMVMLSFVLIFADLWWGYRASSKKYQYAESIGNETLKEKFKWSKSRAVRRTCNKIIDYLSYLVVGAFLGLAITEPMDICSHVISALVGLLIGCGCEIASIVGHVAFVKYDVEIEIKDIWRWLGKVFLAIIKKKNSDIGEAIEEANEKVTDEQIESARKRMLNEKE